MASQVIPPFYGIRRFVTVLKRRRKIFGSLRFNMTNFYFIAVADQIYTFIPSPIMLHVAPIIFYSFLMILGEEHKLWGRKVKCTLVQALRLCTGRTARRRCRGIALLFLDHGTRKRWGVSATPRPLFIPGKDSVPILQEPGWVPGPVWTGAENLAPPGFDPRTVQPIASRYTDYATRPTTNYGPLH